MYKYSFKVKVEVLNSKLYLSKKEEVVLAKCNQKVKVLTVQQNGLC